MAGRKILFDWLRVVSDAGVAFSSGCVTANALGTCPGGNGLQCVHDAGWYSCASDGTWQPLGTGTGSGVASVAGSSPIASSGGLNPTISCAVATANSGGCLTINQQDIGGPKHFVSPLTAVMIDAGLVLTPSIEPPVDGQTISLLGKQSGGSATPDVIIGSAYGRSAGGVPISYQAGGVDLGHWDYAGQLFANGGVQLLGSSAFSGNDIFSLFGNGIYLRTSLPPDDVSTNFLFDCFFARTSGRLFEILNAGAVRMYQQWDGTLNVIPIGDNVAFQDSSGISGHLSLTVAGPGPTSYLFVAGQLPTTYWGFHGATTVGNTIGMQSGFLFEVTNPLNGDFSDKKFMIDYLGGLYPAGSSQPESLFGVCGNYQNNPENDGGPGYYVMTDAGVEQEGTQRYALDKHRWCYCNPNAGDGGLPGSLGDGWLRVKDEQPCAL